MKIFEAKRHTKSVKWKKMLTGLRKNNTGKQCLKSVSVDPG